MTPFTTEPTQGEIELAARAIGREGSPRGRESARDYRLRLAKAALSAASREQQKAGQGWQAETINTLMRICDGSNWPEYAQQGDGYRAYSEITERLHEIVANLQAAKQTRPRIAFLIEQRECAENKDF